MLFRSQGIWMNELVLENLHHKCVISPEITYKLSRYTIKTTEFLGLGKNKNLNVQVKNDQATVAIEKL